MTIEIWLSLISVVVVAVSIFYIWDTVKIKSQIKQNSSLEKNVEASTFQAAQEKFSNKSTENQDIFLQKQNIVQAISTIRSISEHTNLVALHAAIEAARAGERGRGLAAIADEVRNLAVRSKNSVEEISSMVKNMESVTNEISKTKGYADEKVFEVLIKVAEELASIEIVTEIEEESVRSAFTSLDSLKTSLANTQ